MMPPIALPAPPIPPPPVHPTGDEPLQVLHESRGWLVLNKPAGWLCVPGRGHERQDCLLRRAEQNWGPLRTVHRLDQATSGLVVLARTEAAQRHLSRAFEERLVGKRYAARVQGHCPGEGLIDQPIGADWPNRPRQKIDPAAGRRALTRWAPDPRSPARPSPQAVTDLLLWPITGRTHQLRVHLLSIGHPVVGDVLYGAQPAERLMLHAEWLRVPDPDSGDWVEIDCPPPWWS